MSKTNRIVRHKPHTKGKTKVEYTPAPSPILPLLPAHCEPVGDSRRRKMVKAARLLIPDHDNPGLQYEPVGGFFRVYASHTEPWCGGQADPTVPVIVGQVEILTPRKRMAGIHREINHVPHHQTLEEMEAEQVAAFNAGFFESWIAHQAEEKVYG